MEVEFTKEINCGTCKNGYFECLSLDGWHNCCGAGRCYLCQSRQGRCSKYEKGDVPKGKTRNLQEVELGILGCEYMVITCDIRNDHSLALGDGGSDGDKNEAKIQRGSKEREKHEERNVREH